MKRPIVAIKLGGATLQDDSILEIITEALIKYRHVGHQVVLIHGGGPAINAELTRRGISWSFVRGQRVTTPEMMDVIEMVLSGSINRKLVRYFNSHDLPAYGFSGVDAQTFLCKQASEELGQVGQIETVHAKWLEDFMAVEGSPVPVMAPLGTSADGQAFNINADWAASRLAAQLRAQSLIFLTDQKGILNSDAQVMHELRLTQLQDLVDCEVVTGGMCTKVLSIIKALQNGVQNVRVMKAQDLLQGMADIRVGTWCRLNHRHEKECHLALV